ncbi:MAG: hypothetical protein RL235_635 [Chlamydiota bacterium]|jgi:glyoxylase-like metal-dependent hydrolase (beta-lactamase superfamily II)
MFLYKFSCGPLGTNAILIGCGETKRAAVVDPAPGSLQFLLEKAEEAGLVIEKILLTHSHWDHIADAQALRAKTKATLYVHPLDAKNVEEPGSDGLPPYVHVPPTFPDVFLHDRSLIEVGSTIHFEVIHTRGHSPGSVCFFAKEKKLLISGDTLFKGSIGNLHLPTAEPSHMWDSLDKLAQLPADTIVVPGHGEDTTIGAESWLSRSREIFSEL